MTEELRSEIYKAFRGMNKTEQGKLVADLISVGVNTLEHPQGFMKSLASSIRNDHRSLQAEVYEGVINLIAQVAGDYDNRRYDGRNSSFVRTFKAIHEKFFDRTFLKKEVVLPPDAVGY